MWPQAAEYSLKAIESSPKLTLILMQDSMVYKQIFTSPFFKYSLRDEMNDAKSKAYVVLLSSLHNMGQDAKMILISKIAIEDQNLTDKGAFYYYAGLSYFEMNQMEKAFLLFQKSLSIDQNNPDVYFYMASIYEKAGQLQQAKQLLEICYALHQKNDPRFPYEREVNLRFF